MLWAILAVVLILWLLGFIGGVGGSRRGSPRWMSRRGAHNHRQRMW
jgi:hypothetical protein